MSDRSELETSGKNVDVARRALAFFVGLGGEMEPGQVSDRLPDDALESFLDPEVELIPIAQGILSGNSYRGYEGVRRFWSDFFSAWDEFQGEPQEFLEAGDQVVVVMRMRGRMHELEVDEVWSQLLTFRDGRLLRSEAFSSPDGALEASVSRRSG